MCLGETANADEVVKMQGQVIKKVDEFKYLGSTVQSDGGADRDVRRRIQGSWGA